jgi:hypothetical protein
MERRDWEVKKIGNQNEVFVGIVLERRKIVLNQYMQHTYSLLMMTLDPNEAFMMICHKKIRILRHTFFFLLSRSLLFRFQLPSLTSFISTNCVQVTSFKTSNSTAQYLFPVIFCSQDGGWCP